MECAYTIDYTFEICKSLLRNKIDFPLVLTTHHLMITQAVQMITMFAVTIVTYPQRRCRKSERHGQKITGLRKNVMHLNLADYLYDLEATTKETGELSNLKINYVMNYKNVSCYI